MSDRNYAKRWQMLNCLLALQTSVGSDKTRLVKLDAKDGKVLKEIAADDKTDVSSILHNPEDHSVLAVSFDYLMPTWHVVDEKVGVPPYPWDLKVQSASLL